MPWQHPTLSQLQTDAANDVTQSTIPGADGLLRNSTLRILSLVQAGMAFEFYGYLDYIAQQSNPFTATDEFLEGWAALKRVFRIDATAAAGTNAAQFTGTVDSVLLDSTPLTRSDGFGYTSVGATTIGNSGTIAVSLIATTTGSLGNADAGTQISLANAVNGIAASGTIIVTINNGIDQEVDDAFRARMLAVYAAPPQGGDQSDYEEWTTAVAGVTRAWCSPNQMGAGTVVVYFMMDVADAAFGGFPQGSNGVSAADPRATSASGDQLRVANAVFVEAPVTALVYLAAPIAQPVPFTFAALSPNTAAIQALITTALQGMFLRLGTALGGTIFQSDWETALAAVPGLASFAVSTPAVSIVSAVGYLPVLGTITWA